MVSPVDRARFALFGRIAADPLTRLQRGYVAAGEEVTSLKGRSTVLIHREPSHVPAILPALRNLMSWDPFREMAPLLGIEREPEERFLPAFELRELKEAFVFRADVPGIEEKDVDVAVTANRLTVSGKREREILEEGATLYTEERTFGAFTRSFTLPEGVDVERVEAELKGGVLTIVVPKKPEVQARRVTVKGVIEKVKGVLEKGAKA